MSLDVSPDGRMIVFDLLGDLYTLPISGGRATQITSGTALNHQPRFSPDGRRLVFISDRGGSENVWIADRDGRNARQLSELRGAVALGAVTSPSWAPDGRSIVVSQRLSATRSETEKNQSPWWLLALYDAQSGRMRWVSDTVRGQTRSALGPTFGCDGRYVYASVDAPRRDVWNELAGWRIAKIDLLTGQIEPEMGGNVGRDGMRPLLSPNGRYLVYATSSGSHLGLRVRDLTTDQEHWLVREVLDDPPSYQSGPHDLVPGYAFTPDGRAVIVAYGGKIHRINSASGRTHEIPFVAGIDRKLGPLTVHQFTIPDTAVRTRSVLQPTLSPDGNSVAFTALDRIWIMDLSRAGRPAGPPRRLTADSIGEFYPSWSPDGRWIVYSTWTDRGGGALRRSPTRVGAAGSPEPSERLTTDTAVYFQTAVAPDGERIVAVRVSATPGQALAAWHLDPRGVQLIWVPITGGRPRLITSLKAEYSRLFRYPVDQVYFTADSTRIYVGLKSWSWDGKLSSSLTVVGQEPSGGGFFFSDPYDVAGVFSPDKLRALIARQYALSELAFAAVAPKRLDTLDLNRAWTQALGTSSMAAHRWGTALGPWVSWSRNGQRVIFNQGGVLFVGDVRHGNWTSFVRVDVPLMVPVDIPSVTLVLRGARLITMRGHEVIDRGDLVLRDNRIVTIGPAGRVPIPMGARVLELPGTTIIPGYVDIHDHPKLPEGIHPEQLWGSLVRLAYGVTSYRDPAPGWGNDIFAYRERERSGALLGPRMFSTGVPYYGTDPPIHDLGDARERVRANAEAFGSETFKVYYNLSTDRRARQLLAMAIAEQQVNATTHTDGIALELASIIDGLSGIEHPPEMPIYDDMATMIALSGTTHTQTYSGLIPGALAYMIRRHGGPLTSPKMRRFVPPAARSTLCVVGCTGGRIVGFSAVELDNLLPVIKSAARVVARAGRVGMGSHGNVPGIGFHWEMWLHALGGMPNHEILRSATIVGATAIGHARDLGSLEPGKLADLQVLDKNPLDDIRNTTSIRYVVKNGRLYRAADLNEMWPRERRLPSIYLWEQGSVPDSRPAEGSVRRSCRPHLKRDCRKAIAVRLKQANRGQDGFSAVGGLGNGSRRPREAVTSLGRPLSKSPAIWPRPWEVC